MARIGLDRTTGQVLQGWAHCRQSIGDIVTTMVGARVEARDYGFPGPGLQDRPATAGPLVLHFAALAQALRLWEPGYRLRRLAVVQIGPDGITGLSMTGDFFPNGHLGDYSVVEADRSLVVGLQGDALA